MKRYLIPVLLINGSILSMGPRQDSILTLSSSTKFPDIGIIQAQGLDTHTAPAILVAPPRRHNDPRPTKEVSKFIIKTFCADYELIPHNFELYITRKLKDHCDSPSEEKRLRATRLHYVHNDGEVINYLDRKYIQDIVIDSMQDAFKDQQIKLDNASRGWSKKKVACFASFASICSSVATVIISLTVSATQNKCD